jgi:serine/threonine protein kinase
MEIAIIHRDLKPDNIGFTSNGVLKLMDFGLCIAIPKSGDSNEAYTMTGCTGSLRYMAKEVAISEKYNEKVDVYSFGLILYEMATGVTPFKSFSKTDFMEKVIDNNERPPVDLDEYGRQIRLSGKTISMIQKCWHSEFNMRPSAGDVLDILMQERTKVEMESKTFCGSITDIFFSRNY